RLLLALLVLGGVVAAVLLQVALLAGCLDALGDLLAARGREVLELGGEAVVRLLCEEGHLCVRHVDLLRGGGGSGRPRDERDAPASGQGVSARCSRQATSPSRSSPNRWSPPPRAEPSPRRRGCGLRMPRTRRSSSPPRRTPRRGPRWRRRRSRRWARSAGSRRSPSALRGGRRCRRPSRRCSGR